MIRAERQGWVVTRAEILKDGASARLITDIMRAKLLVRRHRGVYIAAGAACDPVVRIRAALVAAGPGAVTSHITAAWLQGLVDRPPDAIHITVPRPNRPRIAGLISHRTSRPLRSRLFRGLPCTDPPRTLVDTSSRSTPRAVAASIDRALSAGLAKVQQLSDEIAGLSRRRRGCARLRHGLTSRGYVGSPTPSVLESGMARLIRRFGLPQAVTEVRTGEEGKFIVDCTFPGLPIAVELYGYAWHHSPDQMRYDLARQRELTRQGWTVLVYTWQDVMQHPEKVAVELRAAITAAPRSALSSTA